MRNALSLSLYHSLSISLSLYTHRTPATTPTRSNKRRIPRVIVYMYMLYIFIFFILFRRCLRKVDFFVPCTAVRRSCHGHRCIIRAFCFLFVFVEAPLCAAVGLVFRAHLLRIEWPVAAKSFSNGIEKSRKKIKKKILKTRKKRKIFTSWGRPPSLVILFSRYLLTFFGKLNFGLSLYAVFYRVIKRESKMPK